MLFSSNVIADDKIKFEFSGDGGTGGVSNIKVNRSHDFTNDRKHWLNFIIDH